MDWVRSSVQWMEKKAAEGKAGAGKHASHDASRSQSPCCSGTDSLGAIGGPLVGRQGSTMALTSVSTGVPDKEWLHFLSKKINVPLELLVALTAKYQQSFSPDTTHSQRVALKMAQSASRPSPEILPASMLMAQSPKKAKELAGRNHSKGVPTPESPFLAALNLVVKARELLASRRQAAGVPDGGSASGSVSRAGAQGKSTHGGKDSHSSSGTGSGTGNGSLRSSSPVERSSPRWRDRAQASSQGAVFSSRASERARPGGSRSGSPVRERSPERRHAGASPSKGGSAAASGGARKGQESPGVVTASETVEMAKRVIVKAVRSLSPTRKANTSSSTNSSTSSSSSSSSTSTSSSSGAGASTSSSSASSGTGAGSSSGGNSSRKNSNSTSSTSSAGEKHSASKPAAQRGAGTYKDGAPAVDQKAPEAGRRERELFMEGSAVPGTSTTPGSSSRPVKTLSARHPLAIAAARAGRGQGHIVPGSIRRVRVKRGDTLTDVAKAHRMRIRDLQILNGLKSDYIYEGDVLTVATGWVRRPMPPAIRPGLRRTFRPLFSRMPAQSLAAAAPAPKAAALRPPGGVPRLMGIGGPAAKVENARSLEGRWHRGPKGFSKQDEGWLRFASPLMDGFVSSPFGWRWGSFHEGVDLAAEQGLPILASEKGVVTFSGWNGGYGKLITIAHDGGFSTRYGHCSAVTAKVGQRVSRGQQVGLVGATGRATGPHVHFEVRKNGEALDPFKWCDL